MFIINKYKIERPVVRVLPNFSDAQRVRTTCENDGSLATATSVRGFDWVAYGRLHGRLVDSQEHYVPARTGK